MGEKIKRIGKPIALVLIGMALVLLIFWLIWGNWSIEQSYYYVESEKIPQSFDGMRITQISDLHNRDYGEKLIEMVTETNPDVIVLTGDIIDSRRTDIDLAIELSKQLLSVAPVYFVYGNNEVSSKKSEEFEERLTETGVTVLNNDVVQLKKDGKSINLCGIKDPRCELGFDKVGEERVMKYFVKRVKYLKESNDYSILIAHRPDYIDLYSEYDFDLVLSGHIHGGIIVLPFFGGLLSPNVEFFPEYSDGQYTVGGKQLIVSRGLGNGSLQLRINCRPHLVTVILKSK